MTLQESFEKQGICLSRYRGVIPIFILLIGAALYEFYYELFCLLIGLVGLAFRAYTVGHTPKGTSGRNVARQVAETLNTTGIYSVVRQ